MRKIDKIILHCAATKEGQHFTVEDIDKWHKQRGFKKIGYHFVIYLDGSVHKGRDLSEIGAHCLNQNANSIGICYIGGLDSNGKPKDTRTLAQINAMHKLVETLQSKFDNLTIHGHNEFANKACPCFDVKKEFKQ
ncbi:N-acetylmuramoyl-L-alanine amidase [Dysgonomonas sp. 216]|uniref:N-acetylmuramoyl-L-alanine amidase n=1 Tax=Dysgonomonas sp. 216 TaxID=2302934 RepID=UPI0013D8897B|nr:N-acetylmuramoyl-L-alanine amidase [Dysgonomonas sp. 216]NDW17767.1 N-acetylmuramoyl-L-alanine amidase [Dysgonomonas sp. 216]